MLRKTSCAAPTRYSACHLSTGAVNNFLKHSLGRPDVTIHGFRTTFGSWSVEHGYEERDSEMALGHVVGNNVRNIYKRNAHRIEPRRLMMQAWADYCGQTTPPVGDVRSAAVAVRWFRCRSFCSSLRLLEIDAIGDWLTALISASCLTALFRWKVSNPLLIAATAVIGLVAYPILQPAWVMVK